jgi:aldose 1-epimerase
MEAPGIVTLQAGDIRMTLAPSIGGAVAGFWHGAFPLMRETTEEALRHGLVRQMSCYPLIPYSNRIANGRFGFQGSSYQLRLNFGDHPHSIHGNAWQRPWQLVEAAESRCRLTFRHDPVGDRAGEWPFAYRAEQTFSLDPGEARIALSLKNTDTRAMPAGFGLHPFFPNRPGTALRFEAAGVYLNGDDALPAQCEAVPHEWDYRLLRSLGSPRLDNCFMGWNGYAEIRSGCEAPSLSIEADTVFRHLVVYAPDGRDFFAVEPVSHMNDAVNRPELSATGLRILGPGETMAGSVCFRVGPPSP